MKLKKWEKHCMDFIGECAGWISYDYNHANTIKTIISLELKRLIRVNEFHQFKKI